MASSFKKWIGLRLRRDIFNASGILLLPKDTVLNEHYLRMIMVENNVRLTEDDVVLTEESPEKKASQVLIEQATEEITHIFESVRFSKKIPLFEIREKIIPAIHQATEDPDIFQLFAELQSKDDYTFRHNIGVGIIATMIGNWMNLESSQLSLLSLAATLHDIGKTRIPVEILNKPGKLTDQEYEIIQKHTIYGYELIQNTVGASRRLALVALQHHEREDGNGYPFGIKGNKMDLFSKILLNAPII
ncbi:MAG: HD domain-containing protein [Bacillaceae bacterium]|nr:HD domain-containing protein [Bacillaceae bacterium]